MQSVKEENEHQETKCAALHFISLSRKWALASGPSLTVSQNSVIRGAHGHTGIRIWGDASAGVSEHFSMGCNSKGNQSWSHLTFWIWALIGVLWKVPVKMWHRQMNPLRLAFPLALQTTEWPLTADEEKHSHSQRPSSHQERDASCD